MALNFADILVILFGNGLVVAIVSAIFKISERKSQFDFDARKIAREYYMKIYANIGWVDECTKNYQDSLKTGSFEIFDCDKCVIEKRTSEEILKVYKTAYEQFTASYIDGLKKGYELFIDDELLDYLKEFWSAAKYFYDNPLSLKTAEDVEKFNVTAKKTTEYMEKLFGLKNRRRRKWAKIKKRLNSLRHHECL